MFGWYCRHSRTRDATITKQASNYGPFFRILRAGAAKFVYKFLLQVVFPPPALTLSLRTGVEADLTWLGIIRSVEFANPHVSMIRRILTSGKHAGELGLDRELRRHNMLNESCVTNKEVRTSKSSSDLETPCRKIFDTRVFSGKKGHKGYKKMTFQENRYKANMQNIWYIKKIMLCG